jgi:hypothetical protein
MATGLQILDTNFFSAGIQAFTPRFDKWLNIDADYRKV